MGEIFSLKNQIQNYAWGSREILGRMRGVPPNSPKLRCGWVRIRLRPRALPWTAPNPR